MEKALEVLLFVLVSTFQLYAQSNFSYTPVKPRPGNVIEISYTPDGDLRGIRGTIEGVVYQNGEDGRVAKDIVLSRKGGRYLAKIETDSSDNFLQIGFFKDGKFDNNFGEGYYIQLFKSDRPVVNSYYSLALLYTVNGKDTGVEPDNERAFKALESEISAHPSQKKPLAGHYYRLYKLVCSESPVTKILEDLEACLGEGLKEESDYDYVNTLYRYAGLPQHADFFEEIAKQRFPNGKWKAYDQVVKFLNEEDLTIKVKLFQALEENITKNSDYVMYKGGLSHFRTALVKAFVKQEKFENLISIVDQFQDENEVARNYNFVAWELQKRNTNLKLAQECSFMAMTHAKSELIDPKSTKPENLTLTQWKQKRINDYCTYADTYATILYKVGKFSEGFPIAKEVAIDLKNGKGPHYNTTFALLAKEIMPSSQLQPMLEKMVIEHHSTPEIVSILEKVYDDKRSSVGFDEYLADLRSSVNKQVRDRLKASIIRKAAPSFVLPDIVGNRRTSEEFQGKIVVLDFWATWCGPCKQSFSGLQKVIDKYKNDSTVQFVLVDTWERSDDKANLVSKYLTKNNYSFDVLMDYGNKVATDYKIEGLPTKFVIGPSGNIRFRSIGFSSEEKFVDELCAMIELIKEERQTPESGR